MINRASDRIGTQAAPGCLSFLLASLQLSPPFLPLLSLSLLTSARHTSSTTITTTITITTPSIEEISAISKRRAVCKQGDSREASWLVARSGR